MVNIFSDASCKNFGNISGVDSYFVGNSLDYNLSSKSNCDLILEKINKINHQSVEQNYLHFGEYDMRLLLGFGKFPHLNKRLSVTKLRKSKTDIFVENYIYLLNNLPNNFKIISAITSFSPSINFISYYNSNLLSKLPTNHIDIFSQMIEYRPVLSTIKAEFKSIQYDKNPYVCNPISTSKLFCDLIGIGYLYEEKGNMYGYGTYYIE